MHNQIHSLIRIAPFVVIPGYKLDKMRIQGNARLSVKNTGMRVGGKIPRNHRLVCIRHYPFKAALAGRSDRPAYLVIGGAFFEPAGKIQHRDVQGGHSQSHACYLPVQFGQHLA